MRAFLNSIRERRTRRRWERITFTAARARVAEGAAFLDRELPGWYESIDAQGLELSHGGACVLGQLHGEFRLGLGRASIFNLSSAPRTSRSPVDLGFLAVQALGPEAEDRDYFFLNQAWREEIRLRQALSVLQEDADARVYEPAVV